MQTREAALGALQQELSARDAQLAAKDALIASLEKQTATATGGGAGGHPGRTSVTAGAGVFRSMLRRGQSGATSGALGAEDMAAAGTPPTRKGSASGLRSSDDAPLAESSPKTPSSP